MLPPVRYAFGCVLLSLSVTACVPPPPVVPAPAPEPPATEEPPQEEDARLAAALDAHLGAFGKHWGEAYALSGFVLVARDGRPVYQRGFGQADRSTGARPGPDTSFRIGSLTKQLTAAATLVLAEQGRLRTNDTVAAHLPDYPRGEELSLHQLLTHTAGVWSYTKDTAWMDGNAHRPHTTAEMLALFRDRPLTSEPGAAFAYSNSGYVLLGAVLEQAAGKPYATLMRELVFAPAGLTRTVVGDAEGMADRALGYEVSPRDTLVAARPIDMSVPHAAGAIRSTARDLLRWVGSLEAGELLTEPSRTQLFKAEKEQYAYGWSVDEVHGRRRIHHNGGIPGFSSYLAWLPDERLVVIAWANNGFDADLAGLAAVSAALGEPLTPHEERAVHPWAPARVARLRGDYALAPGEHARLVELGIPAAAIATFETVRITEDDGFVALVPVGQPPLGLFLGDGDEPFTKRAGVRLRLAGDDRFALLQGGLEVAYVRRDESAAATAP